MQTWTDYENTIRTILGDAPGKRYTDTMIQTALQMALTEYQRYFSDYDPPPPAPASAAASTIPTAHAQEICRGAAGIAMRMRAASVTEVFGRRSEDTVSLLRQAETLYSHFRNNLAALSLAENSEPPLPKRTRFSRF